MAGVNVLISNLIAALSHGKEISELKQKFCRELEEEEQVLSLKTKAIVHELAGDVSEKVLKISQLRKEKKLEMDQDDFLGAILKGRQQNFRVFGPPPPLVRIHKFFLLYRARKYGLYAVERTQLLLLLTCSAWPCLGPD